MSDVRRSDHQDRLLDVCLEEVLGAVTPPDVTNKILRALAARRAEAISAGHREWESGRVGEREIVPARVNPVPLPLSPSLPLPLVDTQQTAVIQRAPAHLCNATLKSWLPLALAASLLLAIGGYWRWSAGSQKGRPAQQLAAEVSQESPTSPPHATKDDPALQTGQANDRDLARSGGTAARISENAATDGHPSMAEEVPSVARTNESTNSNDLPPNGDRPVAATVSVTDPEFDSSTAGNAVADSSPAREISASSTAISGTTDEEIIALINRSLSDRWKEAGVRPSPAATEAEWCRRVYLDVIGRIPTVDELEAFLVDTAGKNGARNKRAKLVDRLLESDGYVESYARFWTTVWTNWLIGRTGGMEPNSPVNRAALEQYLRRSFLLNKPYNQFVYELISAQGSNRPGDKDYNGAVNFLLAHLQEKAAPATAKTAQVFLGLQVQCTQCHNHPFNLWKQNRFWELNAFFRQMREERQMEGNQLKLARLVDADFSGEGGDAREAEVYFEQRNGILQVAYPTFIDGTAIDPNGLISEVDRRRELARLVVRSDEMKLAIVNRLWGQFLGYGFTKPVDDLGPHNPPSHPELLARLADEFGGHGYDLRRLVRWIVLSDAYALSSKFGSKVGNAADDPTMGTPPLFSHFYVRQMSAEQLYDSLLVATGADRTAGDYAEQQRLKDQWLEQFAIAFGTDENDEATTFDGTITQTLVMMNGELTRKATSGQTGSFLSQISTTTERRNPLNELYLAALARRPSRAEVQVANGLLTAQSGNTATALEDIWWALLNSNEFILNH